MTNKSITTIKNKLLSTSILIGLAAYSVNVANAATPDNSYINYSGPHINTDLTGSFRAFSPNNLFTPLVFFGNVDSSHDTHIAATTVGMNIFSSSLIFEKDVTSDGNDKEGIYASRSTLVFKKSVTTNFNDRSGILISDSTVRFEGSTVANNNDTLSDIKIERESTATFNGDVTSGALFVRDKSNVIFGNGIDDIIVSAEMLDDGTSNALFNGSDGGLTITNQIGKSSNSLRPFNEIKFKGTSHGKKIKLGGGVFSNEIYIDNVTFTPTTNIILTSVDLSTTHLNNPVLDLGSKVLTFSGSVVHDNSTKPVTINTVFDGINGGHIELTNGGNTPLDLTNSSGLIINLIDAPGTKLPLVGKIRVLDLFVENDNVLKLKDATDTKINAFTANNKVNRFVDWTFDPLTGILSGERNDEVEEVIVEVVNNPNAGNLTPETTDEIINIVLSQGVVAASEAVERLTNSDAVALAISPVNLVIQDATQVVSQRAEKVSQPLQFISPIETASSDSRVSGVAAGDIANKYGAWVSPFYGVSSQGSRSGQPGFKSSYYGGVVGFDSLINDDTALGLALSYIKTDIKHKNLNSSDRTKADSFIVSGYGTYEITKEWFVQSVATFGHSKIKNREIRTEFGATNIAAANYNATSWGVEILTGYNQKIRENVMLTPLFGLEFNRANGINYKETGTNTQNLAIKRGSTNRLEAILGARVSAVHNMNIIQKDVTFLPEIHGNIRYGLLNKKLNIDIRQDGVAGPSLIPRTAKQTRIVYNVGSSITAKYNDQWEYAIGYDARLADKYVAHQGTLKLRLNF